MIGDATRKALKRGASFCCPDCDGQTCFRCFRANEDAAALVGEIGALRREIQDLAALAEKDAEEIKSHERR